MTHLLLDREPALLVLEDGRTFRGDAYGAVGETRRGGGVLDRDDRLPGDADRPELPPPGRRQTAPHVGNTGMNTRTASPRRIWVSGYVVRDPARDRQLAVGPAPGRRAARPGRRRDHRDRHAGADPAPARAGRHAGRRSSAATEHADGRRRCCRPRAHGPSMAGAALADEVSTTPSPTWWRRWGRSGSPSPPSTSDQGDDAAADGRARHRGARAARQRRRSTRSRRSSRTACSSPTVRATRRRPRPRSRCCARCSTRGSRSSASASATSCSAGRSGFGTYKLEYGHRGINQPVHGPDHRQGRGDRPQPRLRGRGPARRAAPRRTARPGQATSASTTTSSRGWSASTCRLSRAVPPGGGGRAARRRLPLRPLRDLMTPATEERN